MLKSIIFDFDGVICESVDIKTKAFRKLFEDHPEHVDKIVEYHMRNGGLSRFEKFKVIFKDFLKEPLTEERSKELGENFSTYVYDAVIKAPLVKGSKEFLEKYYQRFSLFIVSGTPQEEMRDIVQAKGLAKYFSKVYGSPKGKGELIKTVLNENEFEKNNVIYVGDSMTDYDGAKEAGVDFIARINENHLNPFTSVHVSDSVGDLEELDARITSGPFNGLQIN